MAEGGALRLGCARGVVIVGAALLAATGAAGAPKKKADPCVAAVGYRRTLVTLGKYGEKSCRGLKAKTLIGTLFLETLRKDAKRCGVGPTDEKTFAAGLAEATATLHTDCGK